MKTKNVQHILPQLFSAMMLLTLLTGVSSSTANADNWPAWMGAQRDGVYRETGIVDSIPESGLKVKWRMPISAGYAGPAVADGKVIVFDYVKSDGEVKNDPGTRVELKGSERITAMSAATGETIWQKSYDCPYSISYPAGPRCTPTINDDHVYTLGAEGDLQCRSMSDGEVVWKIGLKDKFNAEILIWGQSSHPLVDGDLLYTMVGGNGQGIVALNKMTGEVVWKALDAAAGYCPPSIIEAGGVRQLIAFHPTGVTSLNPETGEKYWEHELTPLYQMSIARPMIDGNMLYASGIRNVSLMMELDTEKPGATELWRGSPKSSIFSANATPLFVNGTLYGSDCVMGSLIAVDGKTGERLWQTFEATRPSENRKVNHGTGFVTRIGDTDRYFIFNEVGDLVMAKMTPEKFESLGRFHVLEPTGEAFGRDVVWSHPAYAEKTLFARNDKEIVAVDLAKPLAE
ncbi:PQQ-like beta-propeller repeat protein [bacterium]|nr:PQQ-like beta-propeller repeat protein [bacterium]